MEVQVPSFVSVLLCRCALVVAVTACSAETAGLNDSYVETEEPAPEEDEPPPPPRAERDAGRATLDATSTVLPAVVDARVEEPPAPEVDAGPSAPVPTKPVEPGNFTVVDTTGTGPRGAYRLFHPKEPVDALPAVVFGPGVSCTAEQYLMLLGELASHGIVVLAYDGEPQAADLTAGLDWLVAANDNAANPLFGKIDIGKLAVMGHSTGSLATFRIAADPRIRTTVHLSGGTLAPHADVENLHAPALFLCGGVGADAFFTGDVSTFNCDSDFTLAQVPVFYAVPRGGSYTTVIDGARADATVRARVFDAVVAWLRWQLADDQVAKGAFSGSACTLCSDAAWKVQSRGL